MRLTSSCVPSLLPVLWQESLQKAEDAMKSSSQLFAGVHLECLVYTRFFEAVNPVLHQLGRLGRRQKRRPAEVKIGKMPILRSRKLIHRSQLGAGGPVILVATALLSGGGSSAMTSNRFGSK